MIIIYAMHSSTPHTQVRPVSAILEPGTSMNVTLHGNYTKMEGPYKAKLKSYYADTDEIKNRDIEGVVSELFGFHFFVVSRLAGPVGQY